MRQREKTILSFLPVSFLFFATISELLPHYCRFHTVAATTIANVGSSLSLRKLMALNPDKRIIGGSMATEGQYPYIVTLDDKINNTASCGGTLIAADIVLTAAHCIYFFDEAGDYSVVIGRHNLEDIHVGEEIEVKEHLLHPNYEIFDGDDYDVALIYLEKPVNTSVGSMTSVVTLNTNGSVPEDGQIASFAGWGDTASDDAIDIWSTYLLEVETDVISNKECEQFGDLTFSYEGRVTGNMICTFSACKDSCQRDSGKLI